MRLVALVGLLAGLSACATVDLTPIISEQELRATAAAPHNIVERTSLALSEKFEQEGWNDGDAAQKTQGFADILLHGKNRVGGPKSARVEAGAVQQFSADIIIATDHVVQASKAAEIFLTIADAHADLTPELLVLEAALLAGRSGQNYFSQIKNHTQITVHEQHWARYKSAIQRLQIITNDYGMRVRENIAVPGSGEDRS